MRVYYQLIGPDGTVYISAGQRYLLEPYLTSGRYLSTDEEDNLIELPLPEGCIIIEREQT